MTFLESRIFELFAVKSQIFKQGLGVLVGLTFYHSPPLGRWPKFQIRMQDYGTSLDFP